MSFLKNWWNLLFRASLGLLKNLERKVQKHWIFCLLPSLYVSPCPSLTHSIYYHVALVWHMCVIDEPIFMHYYQLKSIVYIRIHSLCCVCLWWCYHPEKFPCPENPLCSPSHPASLPAICDTTDLFIVSQCLFIHNSRLKEQPFLRNAVLEAEGKGKEGWWNWSRFHPL